MSHQNLKTVMLLNNRPKEKNCWPLKEVLYLRVETLNHFARPAFGPQNAGGAIWATIFYTKACS